MGTSWSSSQGQDENSSSSSSSSASSGSSNNNKDEIHQLPRNYENILKDDADHSVLLDRSSSTQTLYHQLRAGVYLNQNTQKYWIDKDGRNCFKLYAKHLSVTWGDDSRYWRWWPISSNDNNNDNDENISILVAELVNVCWLEIHGRFEIDKCSPGTVYEVVFVVMMKDDVSYGWETPVSLRLTLPDGTKQEHRVSFMEMERAKWVEIPVGDVINNNGSKGETMEFSLYEYDGGKWKKGLVIKQVIIRPKSSR